MNKLGIQTVILTTALTASQLGGVAALPVQASSTSVTDLEQQTEDAVNEELSKAASGDTLNTETDSSEDEDSTANKADTTAVAADSYETVTISTVKEFQELAKNCRYDSWSRNKKVVLEADLDFAKEDFEPIRTFGGIFNGQGHSITGVSITGDEGETGVFGTIQNTGSVSNLNVQGVYAPNDDQSKLGGIAGLNYGTISNCTFDGRIDGKSEIGGIVGRNGRNGTISNCSGTGAITGTSSCGGIVGYNEGSVLQCTNSMNVNITYQDSNMTVDQLSETIENILSTGDLNNYENLEINSDTGGIAGYSSGVIASCTNEAQIGYEHVGYNVGGIAGRNSGYMQDNANNAEVYGRKDVGGIVGQMQPYLSVNFTEDTLDTLDSQLDELNSLVNTGLNNADSYSSNTTSHLTNISGLTKIAEDAAKGLADEGADDYDEAAAKINTATSTLQSSLRTFSDVASKLSSYLNNVKSSMSSLTSSTSSYLNGIKMTSEDRTAMDAYVKQFKEGAEEVEDGLQDLTDALDEGPSVDDMSSTQQAKVREEVSDALKDIRSGYGKMESAVEGMDEILAKYPENENAKAARENLKKTSDSLSSFKKEIDDAEDSLSALKSDDAATSFANGSFTAGDLQDLVEDLTEQQEKLLESYPEVNDSEVSGKTDDELVTYFRDKYGLTDEEAKSYTENYTAYRNQYNTINSDIQKLTSASAEIWTNASALQQWIEDNDIAGVLSDITDGMGDQESSLSKMLEIVDKYGKNALNVSGVSDSLKSAADTLKNSPDISSELTGALNSLASLDLKINGVSDTMRNNGNNLYESLSQLSDEMQSLTDAIKSESGEGTDNLRAITNQFDSILRTLEDAANDLKDTDSDEDTIQDVSDEDVENTWQGRVHSCTNYGTVNGDTNVGGITGMIGVEYDLDPETDIHQTGTSSLDYVFRAKCIVDSCTNRGEVDVKNNYGGGIAGHMEMGLAATNASYGTLDCSGNYAGGITGYSVGVVRNNTAKCEVKGSKYVGGIAGYGVTLRDNLAMVSITESKQYTGAIAGRVKNVDAEEISGNYYYATGIYGIDGVSYEGIAEGITYEKLLEQDGLPNSFEELVLTFRADDTVVKTITCQYGESISEDQLPQVPEKDGFHGEWSRTDYSKITADEVIEANYSRINTLLTSHVTRESGQSVIEVLGSFRQDDSLLITELAAESGEKERWQISIPDDGQTSHEIRFLASDAIKNPVLYIVQDGKKTKVETTSFGQYISFTAEGNDVTLAVTSEPFRLGLTGIAAIAVAGAAIIGLLLHRAMTKKRRRKQDRLRSKKRQKNAEDAFDDNEWLDDDV